MGYTIWALKEFKNLITKYPKSSRTPVALFFMGEIYLNNKGDTELAIQKYRDVIAAGNTTTYYYEALFRLG